jgi:EmrB/QacA subfamily drug resistance transporter
VIEDKQVSRSGAFMVSSRRSASSHQHLILSICCISLLLYGLDVTIVNVALPAIQRDLRANLSELQWVVDAYTLVVASLVMFAGSTSDRFGRRRIFQVGLGLFTAGSLLCSLAHSIGQLIAFRAVQGLGASMLNPVALSIIANAFPEPKTRARAVGMWGAVSGLSLALGPLIGGALTQAIGWRSIFWINLPIGIAAIGLAARFVPESKAMRARRFDPVGQLLVFVCLSSLTSAVIEGPRAGWTSALILSLFATAGIALAAFIWYEPRRRDPLVDLRFFLSIPFSSATILALCAFASFAGFLFLNALYLQQARGFTAFRTGLYTLPLAIAMMVAAPLSGRLVGSYGTRPCILRCVDQATMRSIWFVIPDFAELSGARFRNRASASCVGDRHQRSASLVAGVSAASSSGVVKMACANVGPFRSCAASILSWLNAAVASRTRVT